MTSTATLTRCGVCYGLITFCYCPEAVPLCPDCWLPLEDCYCDTLTIEGGEEVQPVEELVTRQEAESALGEWEAL